MNTNTNIKVLKKPPRVIFCKTSKPKKLTEINSLIN